MEYRSKSVGEPFQVDCMGEPHGEHSHTLRPSRTLSDGAALFQALGSLERLQVMEMLLDREHCVSELAEELGERSPPFPSACSTSTGYVWCRRSEGASTSTTAWRMNTCGNCSTRHLITLKRNVSNEAQERRNKMSDCKPHEQHDHVHGPGCGHVGIEHEEHVDYVHDGHLHHPMGTTWTST